MYPARTLRMGALLAGFLGGCAAAPPPAPALAPDPPPPAPAPAPDPPPAPPPRAPCADGDLAGCQGGCDEKIADDCASLGVIYFAGEAVAEDRPRALELFRRACDGGSARGCMRLGDAYRAGLLQGGAEEIDTYRRACDAGANLGCLTAAEAYLDGRGVGRDPVYAASLFARVCDKGNATACFELGRLYHRGEGVRADLDKAKQLFQKACELGHDGGCLRAARKGEALSPRE